MYCVLRKNEGERMLYHGRFVENGGWYGETNDGIPCVYKKSKNGFTFLFILRKEGWEYYAVDTSMVFPETMPELNLERKMGFFPWLRFIKGIMADDYLPGRDEEREFLEEYDRYYYGGFPEFVWRKWGCFEETLHFAETVTTAL